MCFAFAAPGGIQILEPSNAPRFKLLSSCHRSEWICEENQLISFPIILLPFHLWSHRGKKVFSGHHGPSWAINLFASFVEVNPTTAASSVLSVTVPFSCTLHVSSVAGSLCIMMYKLCIMHSMYPSLFHSVKVVRHLLFIHSISKVFLSINMSAAVREQLIDYARAYRAIQGGRDQKIRRLNFTHNAMARGGRRWRWRSWSWTRHGSTIHVKKKRQTWPTWCHVLPGFTLKAAYIYRLCL